MSVTAIAIRSFEEQLQGILLDQRARALERSLKCRRAKLGNTKDASQAEYLHMIGQPKLKANREVCSVFATHLMYNCLVPSLRDSNSSLL